jgi:hypothetical protein
MVCIGDNDTSRAHNDRRAVLIDDLLDESAQPAA